MWKQFFIVSFTLISVVLHVASFAAALTDKTKKSPVVITSQSLTADNKNNTAIFEGSVVAKTDDIIMYSDKMTVFYDNTENKVIKIIALGNVKVNKEERALFSDEATYFEEDNKIIFTGNPKAIDGENVISGNEIIFYINDERVVVEQSRVILQNRQRLE